MGYDTRDHDHTIPIVLSIIAIIFNIVTILTSTRGH